MSFKRDVTDPNIYLFNLRSLLYLGMTNYIKWTLIINVTYTHFLLPCERENEYKGKKGKRKKKQY